MNLEQQNQTVSQTEPSGGKDRGRLVTGIILILIGLISLASQLFEIASLETLILPTLGLIFLIAGILTRQGGWFIPGGILTGIGVGVYLMNGPFNTLEGTAEAGIFLLAFAGGWFLITLLTALFTTETMWWSVWPGGVMALIGAALLAGGVALDVLEIVGRYWPVVLIAIGIYILVKRK